MKIKAKCTLCGAIRGGDITSTGNFMKHFSKSHPGVVDDVEKHRKSSEKDNTDQMQQKSQRTIDEMMKKFSSEEVCAKLED